MEVLVDMSNAIALRGGPRTCLYCNALILNRAKVGSRPACDQAACRREYQNERTRRWRHTYAERTGTPHRWTHSPRKTTGTVTFWCSGCRKRQAGSPSRTPGKTRRYCNRDCRLAHLRRITQWEKARRRAQIQRYSKRLWASGPCACCGNPFTAYTNRPDSLPRYCSRTRCKREPERIRNACHKALERGSQAAFTLSEWGARLKEYGRRCAYCQDPDATVEIEHVIPLCRGGSNRIANVVPACSACNTDKGSLTPEEWRLSGRRRVGLVMNWPTGQHHGVVPLPDPCPAWRDAA